MAPQFVRSQVKAHDMQKNDNENIYWSVHDAIVIEGKGKLAPQPVDLEHCTKLIEISILETLFLNFLRISCVSL